MKSKDSAEDAPYPIKYVSIDLLKENPDNARVHGSEIEELINSVRDFGFADIIKVDKNMQIIAGHGRLIAAKANGIKKVQVMILPFDADKAKAFALVDNKTSDDSTWDMDKKDEQINYLKGIGWEMGNFGFTMPDFGDFAPKVPEVEVEIPDPEPQPVTPARESFNVIAYCTDEEMRDKVLTFLLTNDIPGQVLGS